MDLHSSPTLSLFSGLSFLGTSPQRSHLQNKFKLPSLPDYSDLHLCSGSVSLCSKTSLSLTSLPMLSCQLTLNGRKAELRALHNCFYHQGPATCLSNSTLVQPLWTPPRSRQSLAEFPVTCSADTRLNLQFVPWPSLLWCPFCSGHMNSIRPVSTAVPGHQAAPRVTLKEGENTYGRSLVPSMKWKWHQAPIPVSVWRDSCPQPHYSIGLIQNFPNPNCSTSS